jgi:hypothetical protein
MSRIAIPDVPLDSLPAQWAEAEKTGALVNIFRIMLRSPQIATLVVELGAAQFGSGSLPPEDIRPTRHPSTSRSRNPSE